MYSNSFKYCPLQWHFCLPVLQKKTVKALEQTWRILHNSYDSAYFTLPCKLKKASKEVKQIRLLVLNVLKALNSLNPIYVHELFQKSKFLTHRSWSIEVNASSIFKYGTNFLSQLGPNICSSVLEEV